MPLILAIESDRRQTSKLAIVARNQLHAELLVVDTVDQALDKLDLCDPDLILTSPLLPARDQVALAERLRALATDGFRVQTITMPPLGMAGQRARVPQRGAPSRTAGPRGRTTQNDSMDPVVFGMQISTHLDRIAAERAASGARMPRRAAQTQVLVEEAPAAVEPPDPADASDWNELLAAMRREIELAQAPPVAVEPEPDVADFGEIALVMDDDTTLDNVETTIDDAIDLSEALAALGGETAHRAAPVAAPDSAPRTMATPVEAATSSSIPDASAPADVAAAPETRRKRRVRRVPPQDEFGFFDPRQCGFSALFAKLSTINTSEDGGKPKKSS
jgi:hypothetical protein